MDGNGKVFDEIEAIRRDMGDKLLILGHHYQDSRVLRHADYKGDSLELARKAAKSSAGKIIFCGVRFMAESADILTSARQTVYLADGEATCPMAEMADGAGARDAWKVLRKSGGDFVPVVYVNSSAEVKAFCGANGGSACTSGNCERVLRHYVDKGKRIFFLPDEHLATNTFHDMGISDDLIAVYDPRKPNGGLSDEALASARLIAWKGFCLVHKAFRLADVEAARAAHPRAKIVIHPEAPKEVTRACDAHGSTSFIIKMAGEAKDGDEIVIGTERHLVERLAEQYEGKLGIYALGAGPQCRNMALTSERDLLSVMRRIADGGKLARLSLEAERVHVPAAVARPARLCLERMLAL